MDDAAIYTVLTKIFHDVFGDDGIIVDSALSSEDVDEWDSIGNIRMLLAIEKAVSITFLPSEVAMLANAGELVALIKLKLCEVAS